jgi:hypothetical protein
LKKANCYENQLTKHKVRVNRNKLSYALSR